jgi:hypothetical protein
MKMILVFVVIITMIVTAYMLSNDRSLAPINETSNNIDKTQEHIPQLKGALPTTMNKTSKAAKVEQLLMAAKSEKAKQAKRFLPKKMTPVSLSDKELNILKEKSQHKEAEINLLIAEYEDNIHDHDKKQALQEKVKILMAEYNKLILPLALKAMEEKENG